MNEIYLIDVDDVLLNTPELKLKLQKLAEEKGESTESLQRPELLQELHDREPEFLSILVFPGGEKFLETYHGKCILVSTARSSMSDSPATKSEIEFQKLKIKLCGLEELVGGEKNVRVMSDGKEEALTEFKDKNALFIDNDIKHLRVAHELGIDTVHMRREYLINKKPESAPEVFVEAKYCVDSFGELITGLKKQEK